MSLSATFRHYLQFMYSFPIYIHRPRMHDKRRMRAKYTGMIATESGKYKISKRGYAEFRHRMCPLTMYHGIYGPVTRYRLYTKYGEPVLAGGPTLANTVPYKCELLQCQGYRVIRLYGNKKTIIRYRKIDGVLLCLSYHDIMNDTRYLVSSSIIPCHHV